MIRDINLIEYLPKFIQDYREMKQIMEAENPEFQIASDESEVILNNQFITTSDSNGIKRFEKLLGIHPSSDDTLHSRISRVMTRWNDIVPYTYKALIEKLIILCEGDNFTLNPEFNDYKIEIITHLELPGQVDELQNLIHYMFPMNLEITSNNEIYCNSYGQGKIASGMAYCRTFELSDAYETEFNIQGQSKLAAGTSSATMVEISDAYNTSIDVNGQSKLSGAFIGTASVTISDNFNEEVQVEGDGKVASNVSYSAIHGIN